MRDPAELARPAASAPARERFWSNAREALRGSEQDYTRGSIGRAIFLLAIPMVLEMAMESIFAVTDVFFVGRLGPDAVATVGLTESMLTLVYALAMGLGIGTTAVVARRVGEKDRDGAANAAVQATALGIAGAVLLGGLGVTFAPRLLALMGASPAVLKVGSGYTRVMLGGEATIVVLFVVNAVFRGAGDAAIAMRVLWLANAINIVLGPCFIFGLGPFPELGVTGAAVATTIGRGTGALYAISRLLRPGSRIAVQRWHLRFDMPVMRTVARLSGSGALQSIIGMASWIGLVRIVATFGSQALAGYTIGIRIVVFALLPSWGMSNAAATMVGQALGARDPDRAERAVWRACLYNLVFLSAIGLAFVIFAAPIVSAFTSDPAVLGYGVECLRIIAAGFAFYAYGMVLSQSFNGAGDTFTPTMLNLIVFWLWEIPLAWALAMALGMGPRGAFVAVAVAFSTLAVVAGAIFRRGRWKRTAV
ncbi:MAG: MATE family efflux transporter [Deltaproteobacteria bacterium]|nr:MAG: MATE family efflux transporter [Deltaproteobacteria bacterium]